MKKHFLWIVIVIVSISSCQNEDYNKDRFPFDIEDIINMEGVNIYISKETIAPSTEISGLGNSVTSPDYESWLIFINEHPFANWTHPCKYIFVHAKTGKRTVYDMNYPPSCIDIMEARKEVPYDTNGELFNFDDIPQTRSTADTEHLWAVIISGGGNRLNNHIRYWNDCAAMYNILTRKYGYRKDQIIVIMADGTNPAADRRLLNGTFDSSPLDLDDDGEDDIQFAATRQNLTNVFNQLSNSLTSNDELFIFTMDHGRRIGNNSTLVLWNNEEIRDVEFAGLVNRINAKNINIVMGQCYSGGFITHLQGNNRVIATAAKATEVSYARTDLLYDEFVYHWMSAAFSKMVDNGHYISADANKDGRISAYECFEYANNKDIKRETPLYSSLNNQLGQELTLAGIIQPGVSRLRSYSINVYPKGFVPSNWEYFIYFPQKTLNAWFRPSLYIRQEGSLLSENDLEIELSIPRAYFPELNGLEVRPDERHHQDSYSYYFDDQWSMNIYKYKIDGISVTDITIGVSFRDPYERID